MVPKSNPLNGVYSDKSSFYLCLLHPVSFLPLQITILFILLFIVLVFKYKETGIYSYLPLPPSRFLDKWQHSIYILFSTFFFFTPFNFIAQRSIFSSTRIISEGVRLEGRHAEWSFEGAEPRHRLLTPIPSTYHLEGRWLYFPRRLVSSHLREAGLLTLAKDGCSKCNFLGEE